VVNGSYCGGVYKEVNGERLTVKNTSDKKFATTLFNICNMGWAFKLEGDV